MADTSYDTADEAYDSLGSSFVSSFSLPPPSPTEHKPSRTSQTDASDVPQLIIPASENQNKDAPDPIVNNKPEEPTNTVADDPSAVSNPIPTAQEQAKAAPQEDWKELLDQNLTSWRAESSEARAKSESTRLRLEEEKVKEAKRIADEEKELERKIRQEKEDAEIEKKVQTLLAKPTGKSHGKKPHHHHDGEMDPKRWNDVRNAWEIMHDGATAVPGQAGRSEFEEEDPVEVDGRDMTAGDHGGRDGNRAAEVLRVKLFHLVNYLIWRQLTSTLMILLQRLSNAAATVTQGDGNLNPTPASATRRADLLSASSHKKPDAVSNQREAVAGAWRSNAQKSAEEKGAGDASSQKHPQAAAGATQTRQPASSSPSAPVAETSKPTPTEPASASSSSSQGHPQQPPSLTLSLFSGSGHRSLARIAAVVGINLVLPFINGVMLGFGEIFAREVISWTRSWWKGGLRSAGRWGTGSGAAAIAGKGLMEGARSVDISGSGSFP
ncbi:hypothetical protein QFC19_000077 [Naganishia cerealis]|uniref:Uncharacterized protein n=1 Tax=Naganishia cerealis TaxID=610337 RepID=A0ACC2WR15_9TREE|nr:hypothetical protein QFC19_000077 [Naganishia cerealis]